MFRLASFAFALVLALVAGAAGNPLRTVAELDALTADERKSGRDFELEGEIIVRLAGANAVFADRTGRIHVRMPRSEEVSAGMRVRISGHAVRDLSHQFQCSVTNCQVTGSSVPPAPRAATAAEILSGRLDFAYVSVTGTVDDVFQDDVDADWKFLSLKSDGDTLMVAVPARRCADAIGAVSQHSCCRLTGVVLNEHANMRRYLGPHLELTGENAIEVLCAARRSPFDAPPLEDFRVRRPSDIHKAGPRRFTGQVVAVWNGGRRLLVKDADRMPHDVELMADETPPACNATVEVVGMPMTDLYRVNFYRARTRTVAPPAPNEDTPLFVRQAELFQNLQRHPAAQMAFSGSPVRMRGVVSGRDERGRYLLGEKGFMVPYDIGSESALSGRLEDGMTVEVSGVGVAETDAWLPGRVFPSVRGFFVVACGPDDVTILARPPWWTFGRFMTVLGVLLVVIFGAAVWSWMLVRLVRRRSRELFHKDLDRVSAELRAEDRMRLAVELHDSVSQSLTGVAFQVDSALLAGPEEPARADGHLRTARRMLESCREELRNCLWDLRNRALDEKDPVAAIRKTVGPHAGSATLAVDFEIPRSAFSDTTFHDILRILRELVVNAVRHGRAGHVAVTGRREGEMLVFEVRDDGRGFDPASRPGVAEGHFGLVGIEERLRLLGGRLEIVSRPGEGARVRFAIERTKRS